MTTATRRPELIYISDPLCSWCWGFVPSLRTIREKYPSKFQYRFVVGGLRTGTAAQQLDENLRSHLINSWQEVERRSGQPFDYSFLERKDFFYDTEPACRAIVTARHLSPESVFNYNAALQSAFYHSGLDPTHIDTFLKVACDIGLEKTAFHESFLSPDMARQTEDDFKKARILGAHGFPSIVVRTDSNTTVVARGWLPLQTLTTQLLPWLQ